MSFSLIVYAVIALIYTVLAYFLSRKFVDFEKTKKFQKEMKEIQEEFKRAHKANDIKAMEEINKKQLEKSKQLPSLMKEQFKMSGITIVIFLAAIFIIGIIDPSVADDVNLSFVNGTAIVPYSPGLHVINYDMKIDGREVKGELAYTTDEGKQRKEDGSFYIEALPSQNGTTIVTNAQEVKEAKDDMGTRAQLDIFGFNLHGIGLFIAFSFLFNLLLRKFAKAYLGH